MELIIGILMLFGIASVGAEAETKTTDDPAIDTAVIEITPIVQSASEAADTNRQASLIHHPHSIYRDLTVPYGSQQRTAASSLQSCNGDCPDE